MTTQDIQNLKSFDPFAEADEEIGDNKGQSQNYIHIRIQRMSDPAALSATRACLIASLHLAWCSPPDT